MSKPIRILIVEDSEDDALLLLRELRRSGYEPVSGRVETPEAMREALGKHQWDVIISDYVLPKFSGLAALALLRESGLDLPFIIVSGNIGEDIAVEAMKSGAHDYIIKGNLARLVPAVERELREAKVRRERKQAEGLLVQSRQQLFATLENINEGFFTLDGEWRFTYVNTETTKLWNKSREELLGRTLWEVVPQAVGGIFEEQYRRAVRERVPVRFETLSPMLDSWVEARAYPSEDGLTVYFHDITERKLIEDNLSKLNRLYSLLSQVNEAIVRIHDSQALFGEVCRIAVQNGMFKMAWIGLIDPDTKTVKPVASFGDDKGYLQDIVITASDAPEGKGPTGRAVLTGSHVICSDIEHDPVMLPWRDKALKHGFRSSAAFPLRAGSGIIGAFTVYAENPRFFTLEETTLLISLAEDISFAIDTMANELKRREAERKTRLNDALLKMFTQKYSRREYLDAACGLIREWIGCSRIGIRIVDQNGKIPFEACEGYDAAFLGTENTLSLKEDHCICIRVIAGTPEPQELARMTSVGSFFSGNTTKFVDGLPDDRKLRYRGVCMRSGFKSLVVIPVRYRDDVMGAIHLADERENIFSRENVVFLEQVANIIGEAIFRFGVEEEGMRLVSAVESSTDAVVVTDTGGIIRYVNVAFERVTGHRKDEAIGRTLHLLDSGKHDEEFYRGVREDLKRDGTWQGRVWSKKKDGSLYLEDCTCSPVRDAAGSIINYISVRRDVTEKVRLESIAESVNMMNNIGYIFSGVRHEIGNPINSAKMILSVLQYKIDQISKEKIKDYVDRSLVEIGRVEQLLKILKNYNLYETPELENIDMNVFMQKLLELIAEDFTKRGIAISKEVLPGAEWGFADPRALHQVLINIVTNAADALAARETPAISIKVLKKSDRLLIQVSDNGRGMTEQQQSGLFKPFYTSKQHGTGLGLVIVKKMLTKMNGDIIITSHLDRGTTVDIFIPGGG